MKNRIVRNLRMSALAIAIMTISATSFAGEKTNEVTEARQETQIWTTYALNPYLRAFDIKVSYNDGKATLTGKADEDVNKELAYQIAMGVKGIKEVDNQILVQPDHVAEKKNGERSYGDVIEDATITSTVKSKLLWSKYAEGLSTNVGTNSGNVTLEGTATSKSAKQHAGTLAKNTKGVVSVNNKLTVSDPAPSMSLNNKSANEASGNVISDSWITTKVKSSLLYSSNVAGSSIKVSTKDGIVTLSGNLDSGAEQALAIEISQNVRGVKSIESKGLTYSADSVSMQ